MEYKKSCHPIVDSNYHRYQIEMERKKLFNKKSRLQKSKRPRKGLVKSSNRQIATYFFIYPNNPCSSSSGPAAKNNQLRFKAVEVEGAKAMPQSPSITIG